MANLNGFDATAVKPAEDRGAFPPGEYTALIIDSSMKDTKNKDGQYLELTVQITGGEFSGRKVWARLNLVNKNDKAREIAERELSAICHAVGVLKPSDSAQLHNKPLTIRVDIEPAGGERKNDQNVIKAWKPIDGSAPAATQGATVATPATGRSPWGQGKAA